MSDPSPPPVSPASAASPKATGPAWRKPLAIGVALFALALVERLFFRHATPDAAWPYSLAYKGDANVWLQYAGALRKGELFNQGLPLRPPGMGYLLAWLWDGTPADLGSLRSLWCVLGALVAPLLFAAVVKPFGVRAATIAGGFVAFSTALLILSSSLNNETPYLLLALGTLALTPRLLRRPRLPALALFSALHAAACLVRVEHALFFVLLLAYLLWFWRFRGGAPLRAGAIRLGASLLVFALVLAPWHAHAWSRIAQFNRGELLRLPPAVERAYQSVEMRTRELVWDDAARARSDSLPGFLRRSANGFVAATRRHRGESTVRAEDFEILREAYGSIPEPLPAHPFLCLYGPLNFHLANHADASGGFDRTPLEEPPPLTGGRERYPSYLVAGLPPPQLEFTYPPHVAAVNDGYARGRAWILEHPGAFADLAGRKLERFVAGATLGAGGANLPLGRSGVRHPVDIVVPERNFGTRVWAVLLGAVAVVGALGARRRPELVPWLLFLLSKIAVSLLFFGYARHGAVVVPVLALLVALAIDARLAAPDQASRGGSAPSRLRRGLGYGTAVLLALLFLQDGMRARHGVAVRVDGAGVTDVDPFPPDDHAGHRIEYGDAAD